MLHRIVRTIERYTEARLTIGVSTIRETFQAFRVAYEEAVRAFQNARLETVSRIVYADQLVAVVKRQPVLRSYDTKKIRHAVFYQTAREVRNAVEVAGTAARESPGQRTDYRLFMLGVTNILVQYADTVGADLQALNADEILEMVGRVVSYDEFLGWVEKTTDALHEYGQRSRMDTAERALTGALHYIDEHLADTDLTMQSVADARGISVSYLGQLFRRYRDTTFVTYLTTVRIERAKEYLALSRQPIVEVAQACGYRDVYYFSHCFRRYAGLPPKKYRATHGAPL